MGRVLFDLGEEARPASGCEGPPAGVGSAPAKGARRRLFGGYELEEEIARGGMGVVWRARQLSLDRPVALKLILTGPFASQEEMERFRREAQAAASLDHPNIVAIHEVGEKEDQPYFSMQLIEGLSLDTLLRDRRRQVAAHQEPEPCALLDSPAAAVRLIAAVARAVHYAHQHGILHLDLKPANILLDNKGEPHVTDFGLARRLDVPAQLTQSGQVMGTPGYASPEQARGKRLLTTATDIYSLGAVLYHLLTGKAVAQAHTAWETLQAVVEREPVRPSTLNPQVDRDLETVCLKCLAKDPQQRYGSADALAEDLERWLRQEPVLARRISGWERAWKWARREPAVAALAGSVAAVAALGLAGILVYARQANQGRFKAQQASREATERLWASYLAQARANRWSHRPGQRFDSLAALSNAAAIRPSLELRNEAIAALALPDVRVARYWALEPPVPLIAGLVFDAALQRYARAYPDGQIAICRAQDDHELFRLPGSGPWTEAALCFSPGGRFLAEKHAGLKTNLFRVWNLDRRTEVLALPIELPQLPFAFTPDSSQLALAWQEAIHFYDLSSGKEVRQVGAPETVSHMYFDPTGRKLALCFYARRELVVLDAASGQALRSFDAAPTDCAWNYDGTLLASTSMDSQIRLWDLATGQQQATLAGHSGAVIQLVGSPTCDLIASSGWDGSTRLWDTICAAQLLNIPGEVIWFSPPSHGDEWLGFHIGSAHAGIWELAVPPECRRWPAAGVQRGVFDPSGRLLMTAGQGGVCFWDTETRRLLERVPMPYSAAVLLTLDGKGLFIAGEEGLERRSFEFDSVTHRVQLGAPERLVQGRVTSEALSRDGHRLVVELEDQRSLMILDPARPQEGRVVKIQAIGADVSLSPDAKLVALGNWTSSNVTVLDIDSGQPVKLLPAAVCTQGRFSPDGRYLIVGSSEDYQVFKIGSWERVSRLPRQWVAAGKGAIQFSPDSSAVAVLRGQQNYVELWAADTWRELAAFQEGRPLCFSADGAKLAVYSEEDKMITVWDLGRIHRQLTSLGLDWGRPALPVAGSPTSKPGR